MVPPSKPSFRLSRRSLAAGLLLLALTAVAPGHAAAQAQQRASPAALVEKLKGGGYNIYVRHTATDWSRSDKIGSRADISSCDKSKVRQLSGKGRRAARALGAALRDLGVRLGKAVASPYCRTMETARLLSGKEPEATGDLINLRSVSYFGGREAVVSRTRRRLSQPPPEGVNGLLAAHGNLGIAATGESLGEGELLIVQPQGSGRFAIAGRLKLEDLETLSGR